MSLLPPGPTTTFACRAEDWLSLAAFAAMVLLALGEVAARTVGGGSIPGSIVLVQQLTLWVALLGAALAARSDQLLALSTPYFLPVPLRGPIRIFTSALGSGITASLCLASADLVRIEREAGGFVAWGIPAWAAMTILPAGFAVIAGRIIWHAADTVRGRLLAALGLALPVVFATFQAPADTRILMPSMLMIVAATACGMPIFCGDGRRSIAVLLGRRHARKCRPR